MAAVRQRMFTVQRLRCSGTLHRCAAAGRKKAWSAGGLGRSACLPCAPPTLRTAGNRCHAAEALCAACERMSEKTGPAKCCAAAGVAPGRWPGLPPRFGTPAVWRCALTRWLALMAPQRRCRRCCHAPPASSAAPAASPVKQRSVAVLSSALGSWQDALHYMTGGAKVSEVPNHSPCSSSPSPAL